ncbi:MAG: hypothetical protein Q9162_006050 [Coniocarpon cinnabarinum]
MALNGPVEAQYQYSTVSGYFLQDENSTDSSTFDYAATNFGLINQTYPDLPPSTSPDAPSQWQQFAAEIQRLQSQCDADISYKVLFMGRHGEGYHNTAESYYGTPAWNCYWSLIDGNGTTVWSDAQLTPTGVAQAQTANNLWTHLIKTQNIPTPNSFYVSPLTRCLQTANVTWDGVPLPPSQPFIPTVKELFRESISLHTCDRRSSKTYIAAGFPSYKFEPGFAETDQLWSGVLAETDAARDVRSQKVLDQIFAAPETGTYVSITSHSGEIASILRVLGHRTFGLSTGAVIPVVVRAEKKKRQVMSQSWTASAHCTTPPVSSVSGGACVCPESAAPVTSTLPGSEPTQAPLPREL